MLTCIASAGALIIPKLYRDNSFYRAAWQANDVVTLLPAAALVVSFFATFLMLVAVPLAVVELSQCWRFILTGITPEIPPLIMALDLTLVIPNTILGACLLIGKKMWGTVIATAMLVKLFGYGLVLVAGTSFIAISGAGPRDPLLPFYIFVSAGGFIFVTVLSKDIASVTPKR